MTAPPLAAHSFNDTPCPWAGKNAKKHAGNLTCLGGECEAWPRLCRRKKQAAEAKEAMR